MADEYITRAEFGQFQAALWLRLDTGFESVAARLTQLDTRTEHLPERLVALETHRQVMTTFNARSGLKNGWWTPKRQIAVGAGAGAGLLALLIELLRAGLVHLGK